VCKDKAQGGLGVMNLDIMNKALLAKWIIKFKDSTVQGYWKDILHFKYDVISSRARFSTFWRDVTLDSDIIDFCLNKNVGNGNTIYFRTDRWIGNTSLSYEYPQLFFLAYQLSITVASVFVQGISNLKFKQELVGSQIIDFHQLLLVVSNVQLNTETEDQISWRWNNSSVFTVHSFYMWLNDGGTLSKDNNIL
jgi:hypothetical protein